MPNSYEGNAGYLFYKKMYIDLGLKGERNQFWKETVKLAKAVSNDEKKRTKKNIENLLTEGVKPNQINFFDRNLNDLKSTKFKKVTDVVLGDGGFELITTYPGLLLGSGYAHDTGLEGDFKLGFFFDYTTGMPIIPGSSLKGVLRSAFKYSKYIIDTLLELSRSEDEDKKISLSKQEISELNIENLEKEIFDGKINGGILPMNKRDVFYDAEIISLENKNKQIFADDFLCPHGDDPLKNPTPLRFLKVAPNVKFKFRFKLNNNMGQLKLEDKEKLFKQIILDLGIGAKTNVGYGQFDEVK